MVEHTKAPALACRGLAKQYGGNRAACLGGRPRSLAEARFALAPVDLEVPAGSSLAVLGRNGAGKSTFLRLLAGTARPSAGFVQRRGRVGLLLDLGSGLVEDWTGAQNVRAALRLGSGPVGGRPGLLAQVHEFSGLGEFFARPVRTYSSGMRLRLAYAAVVATRPEILIADEVLAVGDEGFQRRCSQHIADFVASGGTLVLATHNLYLAEKLCDRALWLERGRVQSFDRCGQVARSYRASVSQAQRETRRAPALPEGVGGGRGFRVRVVGGASQAPLPRDGLRIPVGARIEVSVPRSSAGMRALRLEKADGSLVTRHDVSEAPGRLVLETDLLLPGRYRLWLNAGCAVPGARQSDGEAWLDCVGEGRELGAARLPHQWALVRGA